jgi:hypothetical protein
MKTNWVPLSGKQRKKTKSRKKAEFEVLIGSMKKLERRLERNS